MSLRCAGLVLGAPDLFWGLWSRWPNSRKRRHVRFSRATIGMGHHFPRALSGALALVLLSSSLWIGCAAGVTAAESRPARSTDPYLEHLDREQLAERTSALGRDSDADNYYTKADAARPALPGWLPAFDRRAWSWIGRSPGLVDFARPDAETRKPWLRRVLLKLKRFFWPDVPISTVLVHTEYKTPRALDPGGKEEGAEDTMLSSNLLMNLDCASHRIRGLKFAPYRGRNPSGSWPGQPGSGPMGAADLNEGWKAASPDSPGGRILARVCDSEGR